MTDKQTDALRLADALERPGYGWHSTPAQCAAELRRLYAEIETLRTGYEAARLEIESLKARPAGAQQPSAAYAALPEPLEIDWPELHSQALGCGVEDRGLHNRYECAEYGWQDGVDKCAERVPEQIFDADQMRAFADATCAMRASHGQAPAPAATGDDREGNDADH